MNTYVAQVWSKDISPLSSGKYLVYRKGKDRTYNLKRCEKYELKLWLNLNGLKIDDVHILRDIDDNRINSVRFFLTET